MCLARIMPIKNRIPCQWPGAPWGWKMFESLPWNPSSVGEDDKAGVLTIYQNKVFSLDHQYC